MLPQNSDLVAAETSNRRTSRHPSMPLCQLKNGKKRGFIHMEATC
ncbi:hypothetical protein RMSM_06725 [Rhodopirellula maiorica SM1]|uniref:Uncharacterized protein n=1 Tax=Rhodopirellula maiorica SM1 TaxID=1265738 RepID=M5RBA3_9BACT|nr:hypothetical protein [Rhodopirellula maiorica]EMI16321.1 hypothetical protein RMSM_06725 [Rhodopirellula maiorica SM1]